MSRPLWCLARPFSSASRPLSNKAAASLAEYLASRQREAKAGAATIRQGTTTNPLLKTTPKQAHQSPVEPALDAPRAVAPDDKIPHDQSLPPEQPDKPAHRNLHGLSPRAKRIAELDEAQLLSYPRVRTGQRGLLTYTPTHFKANFKHVTKQSTDKPRRLAQVIGRVRNVRRMGAKLLFIDINAGEDSVQGLYNFDKLSGSEETREDRLRTFKSLGKLIRRGDHVSILGRPARTDSGELCIAASELPLLLSPTLTPLPQSLKDEEAKMHQRHVDLLVNQETRQRMLFRAAMIRKLRTWLEQFGFVEVQTPILAAEAGGATARPFSTMGTEFGNGKSLALRIAPELWLKRLIVGGLDKIYEIGPCFRNEGIDHTHNPEFTTCEFYRSYCDLNTLMHMTEQLILALSKTAIAPQVVVLPEINTKLYQGPYERVEFIPTLQEALGFNLPDLFQDDALFKLRALLRRNDVLRNPAITEDALSSLPKLLDRLASIYLEDRKGALPFFITHHPECMSPLAKSFKCDKSGQRISARAELFIGGREVANMYEEENNPFVQRYKFQAQAQERMQRLAANDGQPGEDDDPRQSGIDEDYLSVFDAAMPPTGGWGCGVDRLVMLFTGAKRISDVLPFGNLRNVVGLAASAKGQSADVQRDVKGGDTQDVQ